MKTTTFCHTLWGWLAFLFLPLLAASCSESMDEPIEDNDSEYEIEITPAQVLHSILVGNFYTPGESPEPEKGIVLDESRPSERSVACESFELALEDFERYLTDYEEHQQFIFRDANTISVELGNLGSVKFAPATGNGVVARIDINLKGAPEYTVLYRHEASFGYNLDPGQDFSNIFNPGDLLELECPVKLKKWESELKNGERPYWSEKFCNKITTGVVIETWIDGMRVLIPHGHEHYYELKDKWKGTFKMYYKLSIASTNGLQSIYNAWRDHKAAFQDTYNNNNNDPSIKLLFQIMNDPIGRPSHICVSEGTEKDHKTHLYWGRWTWNSKAERIKISDVRNNNIGYKTIETVDYATNKEIKDIDCLFFGLVGIGHSRLSYFNVRRIYPKY